MPSISLCICTMNRPADLERCLQSALAAVPSPDEVLVSDDSEDGADTRRIVDGFPTVRYRQGPRRGLGANRNACLNNASCDTVHFVDDDVVLPNDYYARAHALLSQVSDSVIISGGEHKHVEDQVVRVIPSNADFWGFQQVPVQDVYRAIVINSTLFPASLFRIARFDENLRYGSEEIDMARHAVALGYTIRFAEDLWVEHFPSPINRDAYGHLIDASRLYSTAKAYWLYERAPLKALAYALLSPAHLLGSAVKRRNAKAVVRGFSTIGLALRYFRNRPSSVNLDRRQT